MKNIIAVGVCALISAGAHASTDYESVIGGVKDSAGYVSVGQDDLNVDGGQNATAQTPRDEGGRFVVRFTYDTGVTNPVITYEDSEKPEWVTWSTWSGTRILQIRNQNAVVVPHVTAYLSWRHGSGSPPWSHYHFSVQRKGYQRGDGGCFWESYDWDEEVVVSGAVFNSPHYKTLTAPTADKGSSNAGFDYGMKLQNGSSLAYHKWYVDYEIVWDSYVPSPSTPNC